MPMSGVVDVGRTVGSPCPVGEVVRLTAAHDLIVALAAFGILIAWRSRTRWEGQVTWTLTALYGAGRFGSDFLREDTRRGGLTASQWAALILVLVAIGGLVRGRRRKEPENVGLDLRHLSAGGSSEGGPRR